MEWNYEYIPAIDSTNDELHRRTISGAVPGTVLWTRRQTAGHGSRGRLFFSPDTGLYFSALLPTPADVMLVTSKAALAAAEACEVVAPVTAQIKWVNDIYVDGKKVCGILAQTLWQDSTPQTLLGVGVNLAMPYDGFPTDFRHPATALLPTADDATAQNFMHAFFTCFDGITENNFISRYCRRSLCIGKSVTLWNGNMTFSGTVEGIDSSAALLLRQPDGTLSRHTSGEIKILK